MSNYKIPDGFKKTEDCKDYFKVPHDRPIDDYGCCYMATPQNDEEQLVKYFLEKFNTEVYDK